MGARAHPRARGSLRDRDAEPDVLTRRIIELSLKHSVLSRFTAFLAVDRSEKVNPGGELHRSVQPVEPASGWDMLGAEVMEREAAPTFAPLAQRARFEAPKMMKAVMAAPPAPGGGGFAAKPSFAAPPAPAPAAEGFGRLRRGGRADEKLKEERKRDSAAPDAAASRDVSGSLDNRVPGAPQGGLVERLRRLADQLAQRGAVHSAVLADMALRELDQLAADIASAGHGESFARLERSRHALRALLAANGLVADLDRSLAETETALRDVIAALTGSATPTAKRKRDFWK